MPTIRIDSILGGHSQASHISGKDQFLSSLGIDPSMPFIDTRNTKFSNKPSGVLRPTSCNELTVNGAGTVINSVPYWIIPNPKDTNIYVYDGGGSVYTASGSIISLSDAGNMSSSNGNGAEYYDNYLYLAKNTDIARYGPLNGSPTFNGSYWQGTLSKAALSNTAYPFTNGTGQMPNHVMHRHSDGKLYFGDVVGNQGAIHYISTTKTTVEGDTDNGSKINALKFGYGLWPTAIESYGQNLVIALAENSGLTSTITRNLRAKVAFWDTTSTSFNTITWVEFPDPIITGMKNVDGILYVVSGGINNARGFRISQYVGGTTFKEVMYFNDGYPPYAGALDGSSNRLLIGSQCESPVRAACAYSFGLKGASLGKGMFNVLNAVLDTGAGGAIATAVSLAVSQDLSYDNPMVGWANGGTGFGNNGIVCDFSAGSVGGVGVYGATPSYFWSQIYKIGQPFQIKRIRIPLSQAVAANMTITPTIYFDDGTQSQILTIINNTNFPNSEIVANIRTAGDGTNIIMGKNNFWIELKWSGTAFAAVELPIIIDFDIIPD